MLLLITQECKKCKKISSNYVLVFRNNIVKIESEVFHKNQRCNTIFGKRYLMISCPK